MDAITTRVNSTRLTLDRVRFNAVLCKCNALIIVYLTAVLNERTARSLTFVDIKESGANYSERKLLLENSSTRHEEAYKRTRSKETTREMHGEMPQ